MTDESVPTQLCPTHHIPTDQGLCLVCEHAPHYTLRVGPADEEALINAIQQKRSLERQIRDIIGAVRDRFPEPPPVGPTASELARRNAIDEYPVQADHWKEQVMT